MKGFVETPDPVVDHMVEKLFQDRSPTEDSIVLDPGCGKGAFIEGIIRWCEQRDRPLPQVVGVDLDPEHLRDAQERFAGFDPIEVREEDFLTETDGTFDYVIGNPPYVPITKLSEEEKETYKSRYRTAQGRFDLYILFYEKALEVLRSNGRLVFITPEKFQYVSTADPLRRILSSNWVKEIELVDEETFGELVTYPTITTIEKTNPRAPTNVLRRDGTEKQIKLTEDGSSWQPLIRGATQIASRYTLEDICDRISCGVATGADAVFVRDAEEIEEELHRFAYPTLPGRAIESPHQELTALHVMLIPYDDQGNLLPEEELGCLGELLNQGDVKRRLLQRSCVERKPWYAFHETPPLERMLRPKILCKDITEEPIFAADQAGEIVPRHSVYYIVPENPDILEGLHDYLNSRTALDWLESHCQRAAKGFLRVQSTVLKKLPIPKELVQGTRSEPSLEA